MDVHDLPKTHPVRKAYDEGVAFNAKILSNQIDKDILQAAGMQFGKELAGAIEDDLIKSRFHPPDKQGTK